MNQQMPHPNRTLEHLAALLDFEQDHDHLPGSPLHEPSGYGLWFEERAMLRATERRLRLVTAGLSPTLEQVPRELLATPLLRTVQLLRRHRDVMFRDDVQVKPPTLLITTLAAQAYAAEVDLYQTLLGVLSRIPCYIGHRSPRVPNPVDPGEDLAGQWLADPELEWDFRSWHMQASDDFDAIAAETDEDTLRKLVESRLGLPLTAEGAREVLGTSIVPASSSGPAARVREKSECVAAW